MLKIWLRELYHRGSAVFIVTIALTAAVAITAVAGYAVFNPTEYIPVLSVAVVVLSVFLGMMPKASCGCTTSIRSMVAVGLSDMGLDNVKRNLGFGNAMILALLGLSLGIAMSLCFGGSVWLRLVGAAMAAVASFQCLVSHLRNFMA